jgi:hypothetical protein
VIQSVPAITLARSGRAVVQHAISWGQYPYDELVVKLSTSDNALTVPTEVVLNYDKHQFQFEYEIRAGDKAGEFTVTLTPAKGKAVKVQVVVK